MIDDADFNFRRLPGGARLPFTFAEIAPLNEWDYAHFLGVDGTGGGGHNHGSMIPNATRFGADVDSLPRLQSVQNSALRRHTMTRFDEDRGTFLIRGLAIVGDIFTVVDVVVDTLAIPVSIYPVNGDFVRRNDYRGLDAGPAPLDLRSSRTGF
ncbi:hypothetical protein [Gordonia phthalatica]|uniref:Uncharacterized protein n=1 Tax=Gordonia phthalatica TaxID=1136941 RepID=A0A0N9MN57_9ACTN|nr:hypothetical protein [Gordonia phthalatica]ALG84163.1 hypothetical protein ACH46_06145 [Gordonia phthalatica]